MKGRLSQGLFACAGLLVVAGAVAGVGSARVLASGTPVVTGISATSGSTEGDTHVTISGSGFANPDATAIQFGSAAFILKTAPCPAAIPADGCFTVTSDTSIDVYTMSHPAGTVHVTVTAGGFQSTTFASFTYIASPPVAASLNVHSGTGGMAVTISPAFGGAESSAYDWATSVDFVPTGGGATISVTNSCVGPPPYAGPLGCFNLAGDLITLEVPSVVAADLGSAYDVKVTTAGGTSPTNAATDQFTFQRAVDTLDVYGVVHAVSGNGYLPVSSPAPFSFNIARGIALVPGVTNQGYTLDGWGGVHSFGGTPQRGVTAYWKGFDIARAIVVRPDGLSGYVLDGYGGLHQFGGAPYAQVSAYWSGWDIARGLTINSTGDGGYVLDGYGGLHPWGTAIGTPMSTSAYWSGWNIARGVAMNLDGLGGYVVDGYGGVHRIGNTLNETSSAYWSGWDIARAVVVTPDSTAAAQGGYVLDGLGGLHPFGNAPYLSTPYYSSRDIVHAMAAI